MVFISKDVKKTKEMEQYEKETGKYALWKGKVTEGFKNWKEGIQINNINRERISVYITKENKEKWQNFAKSHKITTFSKLIREGVNYYIEERSKFRSKILKELDKSADFGISHNLKERLTTIKGNLQLILGQYNKNLNDEIISILNDVLEESKKLENTIINFLDNGVIRDAEYDILLIEDDVATVNLIKNYFKRKDYSCKGALTGSKGIEELKTKIPKLILLDIILPDISGFEICKILKSDDDLKKIPIFYLTAITDTEVEKNMEETKADGYIIKPFDLVDFDFLFKYL